MIFLDYSKIFFNCLWEKAKVKALPMMKLDATQSFSSEDKLGAAQCFSLTLPGDPF